VTDVERTLQNESEHPDQRAQPEQADANQAGSSATRTWLIIGAGVLAVALVAGTWVLAMVFQSPAQREANASPPAPQAVFAKVTLGTLADSRSYSGTVVHTDESGFTLPAGTDAVRNVVTGIPPTVDGTLKSGDVLTEVNTRPVFVVASQFDFFRDIGFGDTGADVRVLQAALASRGFSISPDGVYGAATGVAVSRWYRDAGYEAPTRERLQTGETETTNSESSGTSGTAVSGTGTSTDSAPKPVFDAFVPVSELLAVPSLPATIITAPAIGAHVGGETTDLTLGANQLIVRAEVPAVDRAGLAVGDPVRVVSGADRVDGTVASIEAQPDGEDGTTKPSILTMAFAADPAALAAERGETVTVEVQNAVVAGELLIVPTVAVVSRGEGRGVVVRRQEDGSLAEVPVEVRGSLRGMTAIEPDKADTLAEGDEVRVG